MRKTNVGWRFPPTNGGLANGFNDPGLAHFRGNPLPSLAREVIQNSLDATASSRPVSVSFEVRDIVDDAAYGRNELLDAVTACLEATDDSKDQAALNRAKAILQTRKLTFLRIADYYTSGLYDEHWRALVKRHGTSIKEKRGAGGSHGIGKYAPFALSPLRTVFYWSKFQHGSASREQFQGKAVLMSHDGPDGETQGTGFFGVLDGCDKLTDDDIPTAFRRVEKRHEGYGTSLWIAGFRDTKGWQRRIARSVIENFFLAIHDKKLIIDIDPDSDDDLKQHDLMTIDDTTLKEWFDFLLRGGEDSADSGEWTLREAQEFWNLVQDDSVFVREKEDSDLGHCRLWIKVDEDLPSKVALARQTGMVITTQQKHLLRFPNMENFAALCLFDSEKGNAMLQGMENPRHNQFEPNWLPEEDQRRGRQALDRIVRWIREEIRELATREVSGDATVVTELARLLPDTQPDEAFGPGDDDGEPSFDGAPVIRHKQLRRRVFALKADHQAEGDEGDGQNDLGERGGGGGETHGNDYGDGGEGDGHGGTGSRGGSSGRPTLEIEDVRFLAVEGTDNKYHVSFTPKATGTATLRFSEAGDSTAFERDDIRAVDSHGSVLATDSLALNAGQRMTLHITSDRPIGGRAWRLTAVSAAPRPRNQS